jgi:hypothetical protein
MTAALAVMGCQAAAPKSARTAPQAHAAGPSTQRTAGLVVGGVGLASAGVGLGFGIAAIAKRDASMEHCVQIKTGPVGCNSTGVAMRRDAGAFATISTVTVAVGAAALGGGAVLFFTAPTPHQPDRVAGRRFALGATVGPNAAGASLQAEW